MIAQSLQAGEEIPSSIANTVCVSHVRGWKPRPVSLEGFWIKYAKSPP
jgi:hypothetical protein